MWAVSDLNINHPFLCFVLNKLVGNPLYGFSVSAEKEEKLENSSSRHFDNVSMSKMFIYSFF